MNRSCNPELYVKPDVTSDPWAHCGASAPDAGPGLAPGTASTQIRRCDDSRITLAADCAGLGSAVEAAASMCPDLDVRFISELDTDTRSHFLDNVAPTLKGGVKKVTSDMTKRQKQDEEHVDIYISGFPCQPFSTLGARKGEQDPRGCIMHSVVNTIRRNLPSIFILENVVGFTKHNDGKTFNSLVRKLSQIKDGNKKAYHIEHSVLNSVDFGLPQSRRRVFIIGIASALQRRPFEWPLKLPTVSLSTILDPADASHDLDALPEGNVAQANAAHYLKELRKRG